ncbi:hypothetical protein [Catenulispora subtropica]|uniref:Uncharacterized protein n=1 Tax=Catenulispora subtropica TaxID=450798 RepID=A0ABP5DIU0_9ACTN
MATPRRWQLMDSAGPGYTGDEARRLLSNRADHGTYETWFEAGDGRLLAVCTNGERALVMLLADEGDSGQHLVDLQATGESGGFVLGNGQADVYANRDTVPFATAGRAVAHLIDHDVWPDDVTVEVP